MATNLRLVAHAAQRHAHVVAADGAGDRAAEAGLADARRSDEAEDRRAQAIAGQLAHGDVLEDALLDLLQSVVVFVEDARRLEQIEPVLGFDRPRGARSASPGRRG